jgi:hypothetical protein
MFGSSILDIAIGIVFVFTLVSVIASTINEIILSFLNMRGKELLLGLKTLLDDPDATGLVSKIYNHGQIYGLFQGEFDPKKTGNLPSYIPSQNFAIALLDVVSIAAAPSAAVPAASQSGQLETIQNVAAMIASFRIAVQKLAQDPETEKVGKPLISMLGAADNDIVKLKKSLEDWYNSAMDRVSGWYKYRTQKILFVIGLALAISLNADTIRIVKQLSMDSALRQSIVAAAQSAKQPESNSGEPIADQIKQANTEVKNISGLGIGLGWTNTSLPGKADLRWLEVLLGWVLTAIAVSLGAPFWFDMLNKIMVARSTVKPREMTQPEAS